MIGWLLDTNVIAALINPNGAPSVKIWAAAQPEDKFYISILTLGEVDKGIHNLPVAHAERSRYLAARDALEARFRGSYCVGVGPGRAPVGHDFGHGET